MLLVPIEFYDQATRRTMKLDYFPGTKDTWLFFRHPDGQWVSLRRTSESDLDALEQAQGDFARGGRVSSWLQPGTGCNRTIGTRSDGE